VTRESTDALVERLGRELPPVRPIPRLRVVLGIAASLAAAGALARFALRAPREDLATLLAGSLPFACVAAGLALIALGAAATASAASVPGRDRVANMGRALAACGALLALAIAPAFDLFVAHDALRLPQTAEFGCLLGGIVAGAVAAAWLALFARWGAPSRRARAAALGIAAGAAAGALAVHASCPAPDAMHWLFGHAAAPLLAGLLALSLSALFRRHSN
jgi:hypothetical protein